MNPIKSEDELRELKDIVGQHLAKWRGTTPLEDFANVDDVYRTLIPELEAYITNLQRQHERELVEARRTSYIELPNLRWLQIICSEDDKEWRSPVIDFQNSLPIELRTTNQEGEK